MNKRLLSLSKAIKVHYSFSTQENFHSGGFSDLRRSQTIFIVSGKNASYLFLNSGIESSEISLLKIEVLKMDLN
jgi:hypothetical protein